MKKIQFKQYRISLVLIAILLSLTFISTPITALAPITTGEEGFEDLESPTLSEEPSFEEFGDSKDTGTRAATEIVTSIYLEDGVYAFRNIGNGDLWMDLEQNIINQSAHIQQCYYASPPTEIFERAALFKVTRVGTSSRYIIRLMMNNLLTFDFVDGKVKTKRIPANDADVPISDTVYILPSSTTNSYQIKPYGETLFVAANDTQASGMGGAPDSFLISASITDAGDCARWEIHKYTGAARSAMSAGASPSITNGLTVGDSSIISVCSWSTVIGANTPALEISTATASRASLLDVSTNTGFLNQYCLEGEKAGKFQLLYRIYNASGMSVYSATFTYFVTPDLPINMYYIQNAATSKYMDVEGPSTANGANIQQWGFSTASQKQWLLFPLSGGYYTIYSMYSDLCIGVTASNQTQIKQYATENDYTKWYFHETEDGRYALANKAWTTATKVIAAPSDTSGNGADLTLVTYTDDTSLRDEWVVFPFYYEATLYNMYDKGYTVLHGHYVGETEAESVAMIEMYSTMVAERYLELYGLLLNVISTTYFNSQIDQCKDPVTAQNVSVLCEGHTSHTTRDAIKSDFSFFGSNTITYAYWTGHKIAAVKSGDSENRSFSSGTRIFLLNRDGIIYETIRQRNSTGILMHELNHQYGAQDHYHEEDENGVCENADVCSECSPNGRPMSCIMYNSRQHIDSDTIICTQCRDEILSHLNSHH